MIQHIPGIMSPIPLQEMDHEELKLYARAAWSQYLSDGSDASLARYKQIKEQLENSSIRHGEHHS